MASSSLICSLQNQYLYFFSKFTSYSILWDSCHFPWFLNITGNISDNHKCKLCRCLGFSSSWSRDKNSCKVSGGTLASSLPCLSFQFPLKHFCYLFCSLEIILLEEKDRVVLFSSLSLLSSSRIFYSCFCSEYSSRHPVVIVDDFFFKLSPIWGLTFQNNFLCLFSPHSFLYLF